MDSAVFSQAVYQKALALREPPTLVHGDPADEGALTMWRLGRYDIVTDGEEILTCTCQHGQTRKAHETAGCYHAAATLIELIKRSDA